MREIDTLQCSSTDAASPQQDHHNRDKDHRPENRCQGLRLEEALNGNDSNQDNEEEDAPNETLQCLVVLPRGYLLDPTRKTDTMQCSSTDTASPRQDHHNHHRDHRHEDLC